MGSTIPYGAKTALVVVDVQNDFADPAGNLYVSGGEEIVPVVNDEVDAASTAGALVVFTQDWHPPVTPHFVDHGGTWPVHCVRDTWGAELHPDLRVPSGAPVVRKGTGGEDGYSGFSMRDPESGDEQPTELAALLEAGGIEEVVVAGLAQDVCVKATAEDAIDLGYPTTVLVEATRAVELTEGDGRRALDDLAARGVTLS